MSYSSWWMKGTLPISNFSFLSWFERLPRKKGGVKRLRFQLMLSRLIANDLSILLFYQFWFGLYIYSRIFELSLCVIIFTWFLVYSDWLMIMFPLYFLFFSFLFFWRYIYYSSKGLNRYRLWKELKVKNFAVISL